MILLKYKAYHTSNERKKVSPLKIGLVMYPSPKSNRKYQSDQHETNGKDKWRRKHTWDTKGLFLTHMMQLCHNLISALNYVCLSDQRDYTFLIVKNPFVLAIITVNLKLQMLSNMNTHFFFVDKSLHVKPLIQNVCNDWTFTVSKWKPQLTN